MAPEGVLTGVIDGPFTPAGEAAIGVSLYLYACGMARRTNAARVEPIAVGIERLLDELWGDTELIPRSEGGGGVFPGVPLHFDQRNVAREVLVTKEGMSDFMEE